MSNGGRVVHHERRYLPDPNSTILFVGYQSAGTLGRRILEGAQSVTILGEEVPVKCRVKSIGGYSAHADQAQLLEWLAPRRDTVRKVFAVQGEGDAALALVQKIRDDLAIDAMVPEPGATYEL
jgi:metallo-beta-lactamase family protein